MDELLIHDDLVLCMSDAARLLGLSPVKERKIKIAAGCRCENCQELVPVFLLEIHAGQDDCARCMCLADSVVVLCPACHRSLHMHEPEWRWRLLLTGERHPDVSDQISSIIGYRPEPYQAPASPPPAELFEEAIRGGGMDLFQNGA